MNKNLSLPRLASLLLNLGIGLAIPAQGSNSREALHPLHWSQQEAFEWQSHGDSSITPLKVIRWIGNKLLDTPIALTHPKAEFQPTINVQQSHVRVIGSIAYRF